MQRLVFDGNPNDFILLLKKSTYNLLAWLPTLFVQIVSGRFNCGTNFCELNRQKFVICVIYFFEIAQNIGICRTNFCESKTNLKKQRLLFILYSSFSSPKISKIFLSVKSPSLGSFIFSFHHHLC